MASKQSESEGEIMNNLSFSSHEEEEYNVASYRSDLQLPVLRGGMRAEPGVYEGVYEQTSKLLAAKSGTCTTASEVERQTEKS